jgi:hypothetical protein
MKRLVKMIADFWFTAWVNAGQSNLSTFSKDSGEEEKIVKDSKVYPRENDH